MAENQPHPLLKPLFENARLYPYLGSDEVPIELKHQPFEVMYDELALDPDDPDRLPRWWPKKDAETGKPFTRKQRVELFELYLKNELPDDYNQQPSAEKARLIARSLLYIYVAIRSAQGPSIQDLS